MALIDPTANFELARDGLYLPTELAATRTKYDHPVGVDLFAGAGGFSLGFHQAGWHVAAASDFDEWATLTYLYNLGAYPVEIHYLGDEVAEKKRLNKALEKQWKIDKDLAALTEAKFSGANRPIDTPGCEHFFFGDVRKLTGEAVLDALQLERGEVDCVFGGPPCQGFSISGKRQVMDPRNSLVFDFMRLVVEIQPKAFVMENVPGLLSMVTPEGIPVMDALARIAEDGSFGTYENVKKALLTSSGAGAAFRSKGVKSPAKGGGKYAMPEKSTPEKRRGKRELVQSELFA